MEQWLALLLHSEMVHGLNLLANSKFKISVTVGLQENLLYAVKKKFNRTTSKDESNMSFAINCK